MSYVPNWSSDRDIPLASRVLHASDGRHGFVVGRVQGTGWNRALVPVSIEGSTRTEYWPLTRVILRPQKDQLTKLGGNYNPPKGFPLIIT